MKVIFHLLNVHELVMMDDHTVQLSHVIKRSNPVGNWLHVWGLGGPERSDVNLALLVLKMNCIATKMGNMQVFLCCIAVSCSEDHSLCKCVCVHVCLCVCGPSPLPL